MTYPYIRLAVHIAVCIYILPTTEEQTVQTVNNSKKAQKQRNEDTKPTVSQHNDCCKEVDDIITHIYVHHHQNIQICKQGYKVIIKQNKQ